MNYRQTYSSRDYSHTLHYLDTDVWCSSRQLASSAGNSKKERARDWYGPSARSFAPFLPQIPETQELSAEEASRQLNHAKINAGQTCLVRKPISCSYLLFSCHSELEWRFQIWWNPTSNYRWPLVLLHSPWSRCTNQQAAREWKRGALWMVMKQPH